MIQDPAVLKDIQKSWDGVSLLRKKYKGLALGSIVMGGTPAIYLADAVQNIPFIFACSVLNDTLLQLKREKHFKCKSFFLGALVKDSATILPWCNYALIDELVGKRNDLAHRSQLLPRLDCWKYIDAIREQLVAWRILE